MLSAEFLELLPFGMREQVADYVQAVRVALPEIAADAQVPLTPTVEEAFLGLVSLRKLLIICEANRWTLDHSFALLRAHDVTAFRVGSRVVTERSPEVVDLRRFLADLQASFLARDLAGLAKDPLADLLRRVADGRI